MNKGQLIARVQRLMGPGATRRSASAAVEAVLSSVVAAVAEGEKLHIAGWGSFELRERRARSGRLPGAGERLAIPAKRVPSFRPAAGFPGGQD